MNKLFLAPYIAAAFTSKNVNLVSFHKDKLMAGLIFWTCFSYFLVMFWYDRPQIGLGKNRRGVQTNKTRPD
jgi:hypothetical protein